MGPLPSTDLAGHKPLKMKIDYALDRLEELPSVDFKQSASWVDLRGKIVRSILGMGNLRDGGLIIVGVAESDEKWELTGISSEHRESYSVDDMADCVAKYVSPGIEFSVVEHSFQEQVFLVIHVKPFAETPLVCKRDWPKEKLKAGGIYIRPLEGKPQSTLVRDAAQMHDLLELAAESRARRMLEQSHRIGLLPTVHAVEEISDSIDTKKLEDELEGL